MFENLPELFDLSSRSLPPFTVEHETNPLGADNWQLTFPNGYTLSVLWGRPGSGAYSTEDTAELWAWGKGRDYLWDDVRAYQSFSEIMDAIDEVSSLPSSLETSTTHALES